MGLRPRVKSAVGYFIYFLFRIPFPILLLINFHPYMFPLIKTKYIPITVAMETYVELLLIFFVYNL